MFLNFKFKFTILLAVLISILSITGFLYSEEKEFKTGLKFEFKHNLITPLFDDKDFDKTKPKFPLGILGLSDSSDKYITKIDTLYSDSTFIDSLSGLDTTITKITFDTTKALVHDSTFRQIEYRILNSYSLKREIDIDSAQTYVVIREKIGEHNAKIPKVIDYETYKRLYTEKNRRVQVAKSFQKSFDKPLAYGNQGLEITIPIKIKNRAFQTIFGGDNVSVNATGSTEINIGASKSTSKNSALSQGDQTSSFDPEIDASNRYNIKGKVGDKLEISVQVQDVQDFGNEDNVKLIYTGYEDDIIQKIEAGNTSLNLQAGTSLITGTSAASSNLFGIKLVSKIGAVELTSLVSLEKSQRQTKILSGASADSILKADTDYAKRQFYFLDTGYAETFEQIQFEGVTGSYSLPIDRQEQEIVRIEVYKSKGTVDPTTTGKFGTAVDLFENPNEPNAEPLASEDARWFYRLEPNEYTLDANLGILKLNSSMSEKKEILAVSYQTEAGLQVGEFFENAGEKLELKLLKPLDGATKGSVYDEIEMKNVYNIGTRGMTEEDFNKNFQVTIYQNEIAEEGNTVPSPTLTGVPLIEVFFLDENKDNKPDYNLNIFRFNDGYLYFPRLKPFDYEVLDEEYKLQFETLGPTNLEKLQSVGDIYNVAETDANIKNASLYSIVIKGANLSSSVKGNEKITIGAINILEDSEVVTSNGQRLVKGIDYDIDYFLGEITLKNSEFAAEGRELKIEYESTDLFSFDKKALYGVTAAYNPIDRPETKLEFAGTALWLSQTSTEEKPRIGREPVKNFLWGMSSRFNLNEINPLTEIVDAIPLIDTKTKSTLSLQAEFAQSLPNPNTKNNASTGDNNGVAYIDDFEGAERANSVSLKTPFWKKSAPPKNFEAKDREEMFWMESEVSLTDILDKDVQSGSDRHDIFRMVYVYSDNTTAPSRKKWAGITQAASVFGNQLESNFIELWVRNPNNVNSGKLHLEIGKISEDSNGDKVLDTEDQPIADLGNVGNRELDSGEDTGLDGCTDPFEDGFGSCFSDSTQARVFRNQNGISSDDPNGDNYIEGRDESDIFSFRKSNNLEDNSKSNIGEFNRPDTEDLDGDDNLDTANDYLSYSVDLGSLKNFVSLGARPERGWKLYRIPLGEFEDIVGESTSELILSDIGYIRMWVEEGGFNEIPLRTTIEDEEISYSILDVAFFDFVGFEWEEISLIDNATPPITKLKISTVNTDENFNYKPPPGVGQETDQTSDIKLREQSLAIEIEDLRPDEIFWIEKILRGNVQNKGLDFSNYDILKMYVHGHGFETNQTDYFGELEELPDLNIVFRMTFGNNEDIYYEIEQPIFPSESSGSEKDLWQVEKNNLDVNFAALTTLKAGFDIFTADSFFEQVKADTINGVPTPPRKFAFKGNTPSVTNIGRIQIGFRNISNNTINSAEVWVNELRVSGVNRDKGISYRVSADLKFADFFSINTSFKFSDQDFRQIQAKTGSNFNSTEYRVNPTLQFGKFFPNKWNVRIPITAQYSYTEKTPKYVASTTDILYDEALKEAQSDSLKQDIINRSETRTENMSFSTSYNKNPSRSAILNYTIDPLKINNVSYSRSKSVTPQNSKSINETYSAGLDYTLNFPSLEFKPFSWLPLLKQNNAFKGLQFSYFPSRLSFSTDGSKSKNETQLRTATTISPIQETFTLGRSYGGDYSPFSFLRTSINRSEDFDALADTTRDIGFKEIVKLDYGERTTTTQNTTIDFLPKINKLKLFGWEFLRWTSNPTFRTSSSFTYNRSLSSQTKDISLANRRDYSMSAQLDFQELFRTFTFFDPNKIPASRDKSQSSSRDEGEGNKRPRTLRDIDFEGDDLGKEKDSKTDDKEREGRNEESEELESKRPESDEELVSKRPDEKEESSDEKSDRTDDKAEKAKKDDGFKFPSITIWTIPKAVDTFIGIIDPVRFNASRDVSRNESGFATDELNNEGMPSLGYQFGLTKDLFFENSGTDFSTPKGDFSYIGNPLNPFILSGSVLTRSVTDSYTLNSGMRIKNVSFTFSYQTNTAISEGFDITVNEDSTFSLRYDPRAYTKRNTQSFAAVELWKYSFRKPFVNWGISWSGFENYFGLSKFANSVTLTHNYTSTLTESYSQNSKSLTSDTLNISKDAFSVSSNFSPLVGFNTSIKGGVSFDVSYDYSTTRSSSSSGTSGTYSEDKGFNSNVSYTRRTGFRIPRWFYLLWWMRGKKYDNNLTLTFSYRQSDTVTLQNIVVNSAENTGSNVLFANINDLFNDSKFTKPTTRSTVSAGTNLTYSVSQKFT
ncbi:MAG: cell surface protein SprA, partial [Calditrichaeota bacterium]